MVQKLTAAFFLMLSLALAQGARPDTSMHCLLTGHEDCCIEVAGEMVCTEDCCEPATEDCCLVLEDEAPTFLVPEKKPVPGPLFLAILPDPTPGLEIGATEAREITRSLVPDPPPWEGRTRLAWLERRLI